MEALQEDYIAAGIRNQIAQEQQELVLFSTLKPTIQLDGNEWCVLLGDNLQEGVAGFGKSPRLAVLDFNKNWYKEMSDEYPNK